MDIATVLKEFRQEHGLEQEDLAKLLETTQQTVSNWESGTMPRSNALNRINHLLKTYKKGEEHSPWVAPVYHPDITEIHEIPVNKAFRKASNSTMDGGRLPSETQTRRTVAETLVNIVAPQPEKRAPRLEMQFEQQFFDALPDNLKQNCRKKHLIQGHVYRFDYYSDKLVADLEWLVPRTLTGNIRQISTSAVSKILWRLSAHRLLTRETNPDRKYFLFLNMINDSGGPLPMRTITKLTSEAALHNISILWTDSKSAAAYVAAHENDQLRSFTTEDADEGEDEDVF